MSKILVVDDEPNILSSLRTFLTLHTYSVITAETVYTGYEAFRSGKPDIVLLDIFLRGESGLDLLRRIHETDPGVPVVLISGQADVRTAVQAVKDGAYDLLEKPIDTERLSIVINNALGKLDLSREVETLKSRWMAEHFFIGSESRMQDVLEIALKAAATDIHVLLSGPNGSGKEPVAYYIYLNSRRSGKPYITVNCAAIPRELFESELFGHRKGAFTGAAADKSGYFQRADGGTLFLDEIGELPLELQPKLLRCIEYGEIQRPGSERSEKIDVRIIAATNRDLRGGIAAGTFREDLFFRLNRIPITIPSLNERRDEIPGLVRFFLRDIETRHSLPPHRLDAGATEYLCRRTYRGNIRELRNIVERAVVLCDRAEISERELRALDDDMEPVSREKAGVFEHTMDFTAARQMLETEYLETQLAKFRGSVKDTALALGMLPNNLSRKLSSLGIDPKRHL